MPDYPAYEIETDNLLEEGIRDPIPTREGYEVTPAGESSSKTYYLMRGYRTGTNDYETWIAQDSPNSNNPSGLPIINLTIQSTWVV